jgi:hypothetical protein
MDGIRLVLVFAAHLAFIFVGMGATLSVWQPTLRRAAAGCMALFLALGAQSVALLAMGALAYSEGFSLRNLALLLLILGALAGSVWLALAVDHARNAIVRGGGELSARWAALWLVRLAVPIELGTTAAVAMFRLPGASRLVLPAALFATLLCAIALGTATMLRRASRYIARR